MFLPNFFDFLLVIELHPPVCSFPLLPHRWSVWLLFLCLWFFSKVSVAVRSRGLSAGTRKATAWITHLRWPDTELMSFLSLTSELPSPYDISWLWCCLTFYDKTVACWIYFPKIWLKLLNHYISLIWWKSKALPGRKNIDLQSHGGLFIMQSSF